MDKVTASVETYTEYGIRWEDGTLTTVPSIPGEHPTVEAARIKALYPGVTTLTRTVHVGEWAAAVS